MSFLCWLLGHTFSLDYVSRHKDDMSILGGCSIVRCIRCKKCCNDRLHYHSGKYERCNSMYYFESARGGPESW